jgi:multiple antibiotic resistance protein
MTVLSAAVLLFFVMDPLGNVPLFLTALRRVAPSRHRKVIVRELLIALALLVLFLFVGRGMLGLLRVSAEALTVAGGVILLLIALRMIFPTSEYNLREDVDDEPFIVPLAVPYTAGPSALATVLLLTSREPARWPEWLLAIGIAWLGTSIVLYFAGGMSRFLGQRGLVALERLMGMLLVTVAMEMLLSGLRQYMGR